MKLAVYPGSFDPITLGHVDIVRRIHAQFDQLTILVASSPQKTYLFTPDERTILVKKALGDLDGVHVEVYNGLTVNYLKEKNATIIIRGLRTASDFDIEISMAHINKKLYPSVETLLVFASPEYQAVSSHMVKEAAMYGAELRGLIPLGVEQALKKKFKVRT